MRRREHSHAALAIKRGRGKVEPGERQRHHQAAGHDIANATELTEQLQRRNDLEQDTAAEINRQTRVAQRGGVIDGNDPNASRDVCADVRAGTMRTLRTATCRGEWKRMTSPFMAGTISKANKVPKRAKGIPPVFTNFFARFPVLHSDGRPFSGTI